MIFAPIPPLVLIMTILRLFFAVWFNHCCSIAVNASQAAIMFFVFTEVTCTLFAWLSGSPPTKNVVVAYAD